MRQVAGVACIMVAPERSISAQGAPDRRIVVVACNDDAAAGQQRQEQLERGDVERERRHRQQRVVRARSRARRCIDASKLTTARCGISTPFGLPVEPDV